MGDGRPTTVRAFFAIRPSDGLRKELASGIAKMRSDAWARSVRWVREENIHLTLCFLGELEVSRISDLLGQAGERLSPIRSFGLDLDTIELFPNSHRARVVAASVAASEELEALARELEAAAISLGLLQEPRAFRAHVTLGRIRGRSGGRGGGRSRGRQGELPSPLPLLAPVHMRVENAVLYRSELGSAGATYFEIERVELAKD